VPQYPAIVTHRRSQFVTGAVGGGDVTLPVDTCSGRNHTIPLMRRPNTDTTPNKPVT